MTAPVFTLAALGDFYARGGDPREVARVALAAIEAWADPALFLAPMPAERVLARAALLAEEGARGRPLFGVPFVVKDNIDVAGLPTTAGCPAYVYDPAEDAPVVARLLASGAICLGKVNLDQFATGLNGTRSPHGTPRNALDPAWIPGGSSSGSATAVAAGLCAFSLGTDTAGSGRVPAMANGIVGLKPSLGLLPSIGVVPACRSLDCISIFATSVADAATVLAVAAGPEPRDPYSRAAPASWRASPASQPRWRLAVPRDEDLEFDSQGDAACFAASLAKAEALGATIRRVDLQPYLRLAKRLYDGAWVAERTAALRPILEAAPGAIYPVTRGILEAGFPQRTVDAWADFHAAAEARLLARDLFAAGDLLLLPTAPGLPSLAEMLAAPVAANSRLGFYTNFVNICDLAALAIPAGQRPDGRPCGVTLVGPAFSEARLAGLATAMLGETTVPPMLAGDEVGLLAIGAHMSGLPLNPQALRHGGRFIAEAMTVPHYRLYDLGNRPGMVRVAHGGVAVAGEIWAFPLAGIGPFLAEIPPPLGFGRVTLADGSTPLGFLAEAIGVADAPDISALGGWRAHLRAKEQG
jgi:allophanate hydrolase